MPWHGLDSLDNEELIVKELLVSRHMVVVVAGGGCGVGLDAGVSLDFCIEAYCNVYSIDINRSD
jgi:hypothetical protein